MLDEVQVWSETVKIPTYKIGTPDKNPMFLEKRVYQGSSGAVYPHRVIDFVVICLRDMIHWRKELHEHETSFS